MSICEPSPWMVNPTHVQLCVERRSTLNRKWSGSCWVEQCKLDRWPPLNPTRPWWTRPTSDLGQLVELFGHLVVEFVRRPRIVQLPVDDRVDVLCYVATTSHTHTGLCSATYVRWQRGTARIRPLHAAAAAIDQYLLPAGPTAANLQQWVCCCEPMLGQTDGHRTVS